MKVLFVCRANSGRSQIAMELYNKLHPGEAYSAGTKVDVPGQHLKYRETAGPGILAMHKLGIDMSENPRTQLTERMVREYDVVVVLAEPEAIPYYLYNAPNVKINTVEDTRYKSPEQVWEICREIWRIVQEVSKSVHPVRRALTVPD